MQNGLIEIAMVSRNTGARVALAVDVLPDRLGAQEYRGSMRAGSYWADLFYRCDNGDQYVGFDVRSTRHAAKEHRKL